MSLWGDVKHVASDVVNAPDAVAHSASQAFHDEVYGSALGRDLASFGHQAKLFGEGLVSGAVMNPINGVTELVGGVTGAHLPKLEFSNQSEVDHSWAGRIGKLGGAAADFALTAGGVSAVAGADASSALVLGSTGAIQGSVFTPSENNSSTGDMLAGRLEQGVVGGAAGMVMGGVAGHVEGKMAETEATKVEAKVVASVAGGTASGVTRAEGKSFLETGEAAPPQVVAEQAMGGAVAGLASKIPTSVSPEISGTVVGKVADSSFSSATGGVAGNVAGQENQAMDIAEKKTIRQWQLAGQPAPSGWNPTSYATPSYAYSA
jgi:hypothetical protein